MSIFIKQSGAWKMVKEPRVKQDGDWKDLKAVHIKHEGQWRMVWSRWAPIDGRLVGIVSSGDFISGNALASSIGLTAGTAQNSTCDWLHFELEGQDIMVPTMTFRHSVSWRHIYERGAVYSDTEGHGPYPGGSGVNQNRYVTIGGTQYKVTLLKGSNGDNQTHIETTNIDHPSRWDSPSTHDSEWNKLMYRVSDGVHDSIYISAPTIHTVSHPYKEWASMNNNQLWLDFLGGSRTGTASWCQEKATYSEDSLDRRVDRGLRGVSYVSCTPVANSSSHRGWRPALRKM